MLAEIDALREINDIRTNGQMESAQKITILKTIFADGVPFDNREQADDVIVALGALVINQKDPNVRVAALQAMQKMEEEETEDEEEGLFNDKPAPVASANDDQANNVHACASELAKRQKRQDTVDFMLDRAENDPAPAVKLKAIESAAALIEKRGYATKAQQGTLTLLGDMSSDPEVRKASLAILNLRHPEPQAVVRKKVYADG